MERFPEFGRPIRIGNNLMQQIRVIPPQPHMEHEVLFKVLFEFKYPIEQNMFELFYSYESERQKIQEGQKIQKIQERQERKERKNYHKFNNKIINITNKTNKRFFIPQTKQK